MKALMIVWLLSASAAGTAAAAAAVDDDDRGASWLGPFVTMIYEMCRTDCVQFMCIYVIFMCGFVQSKRPTAHAVAILLLFYDSDFANRFLSQPICALFLMKLHATLVAWQLTF